MHSETLVVDRIAAMRPRTFDSPSPRNRSHFVNRVPRLHRWVTTHATRRRSDRLKCHDRHAVEDSYFGARSGLPPVVPVATPNCLSEAPS